jgi:hypothetical protein
MNTFARTAIVATAVIVVGAVGLAVVRPFRPADSGPAAVASPSPSSSPLPSASAPPSRSPSPLASPTPSQLAPLTGSFTSAVFGVSSSYPAGWTIHPATKLWTTGVPWPCTVSCGDVIEEKEDDSPFFALASQPLGKKSAADWTATILGDPEWEGSCPMVTESITIDGTAGTLARTCPDGRLIAVTTSGGRGYYFMLYRVDDITQFKAILATVRLQPDAAKASIPSTAPSG